MLYFSTLQSYEGLLYRDRTLKYGSVLMGGA